MNQVIILGAGIAGLSAAYRMTESGCNRLVLLEALDAVGGLSRSVTHDGYIFDLGAHQIHTEHKTVIGFLERILQEDLLIAQKKASHVFFGRYLNYPLGIRDILLCLPFHLSVHCFLSFLYQTAKNIFIEKRVDSSESWIISHFGRKMYEIYFKPYTQKVWGKPPSELDVLVAKQRIAVEDLIDVLLAAVSKRLVKHKQYYHLPHSPYQKIFYYPKHGVGQLSELMSHHIQKRGGKLCLGSSVVSLSYNGGTYRATTADGSVYEGKAVVSTIPVTDLQNMLARDQDALNPAETLEFRSLTFLLLAIKKERVSDNHWIYFPDSDCIFQRVTEPKNFSPYLVPRGHASVCVEIPCDYMDRVWNMDKKELFEKVIIAMEEKRYLQRKDVETYWLARERWAYPTHTCQYRTHLQAINNYISTFPHLYSIGRQGRFSYVNIDEVMLMGFETAENIVNNLKASA